MNEKEKEKEREIARGTEVENENVNVTIPEKAIENVKEITSATGIVLFDQENVNQKEKEIESVTLHGTQNQNLLQQDVIGIMILDDEFLMKNENGKVTHYLINLHLQLLQHLLIYRHHLILSLLQPQPLLRQHTPLAYLGIDGNKNVILEIFHVTVTLGTATVIENENGNENVNVNVTEIGKGIVTVISHLLLTSIPAPPVEF